MAVVPNSFSSYLAAYPPPDQAPGMPGTKRLTGRRTSTLEAMTAEVDAGFAGVLQGVFVGVDDIHDASD